MKRIGVAGLIMSPGKHNEHLLMGRRGKDPNRGLYVLPGGGVQDGESLEEAFVREVKEETGLEIEPTIGFSRWENPHVIELKDRIILVAKASIKVNEETGNDSPKDGSDLYDVAWFDILKLPNDISQVVLPVIKMRGFRQEKPIPKLKLTNFQVTVLKAIRSAPGSEIEAKDVPSVTWEALLAKEVIEQCPRLYFGPRSLRYRLTELGKQWVIEYGT